MVNVSNMVCSVMVPYVARMWSKVLGVAGEGVGSDGGSYGIIIR